MYLLITIVHVFLCLFLITVVLLQSGRGGGDVGAAFGGAGASSTVFGAAGATSFLGRLTTGVAVLFMTTTVSLAWFSTQTIRRDSVIDASAVEAEQKAVAPQTEGAAGTMPPDASQPAGAPEGATPVPTPPAAGTSEPVTSTESTPPPIAPTP